MKQVFSKWRYYFNYFMLLSFLTLSCDKDQDLPIPYVPVSFTVNLNIVNELYVPTNSVLFPNMGYGGVIVYCEQPGSYYAFDAACTLEKKPTCQVQNEGIIGTCSCCGSQFILLNGYPSEGLATRPLQQYNVSMINNFQLRVYN